MRHNGHFQFKVKNIPNGIELLNVIIENIRNKLYKKEKQVSTGSSKNNYIFKG